MTLQHMNRQLSSLISLDDSAARVSSFPQSAPIQDQAPFNVPHLYPHLDSTLRSHTKIPHLDPKGRKLQPQGICEVVYSGLAGRVDATPG